MHANDISFYQCPISPRASEFDCIDNLLRVVVDVDALDEACATHLRQRNLHAIEINASFETNNLRRRRELVLS